MSKSLLQLLLIAQYVLLCQGTLSVKLSKGNEFCFVVRTPGKDPSRISGNYDMLDDELSPNPVTVVLFDYDSEKVLWHSTQGMSEGSFSLTLSGQFHLCFGNGSGGYKTDADRKREMMRLQGHPVVEDDDFDYTNLDGQDRNIGFSIRVTPTANSRLAMEQERNSEKPGEKSNEQATKLVDLTYQVREKVEMLLDHQEYIKNRESIHRHVVEETFTMVMRWTLLEASVLTFVACAQVFYLKRFFETKRFL